MKPSDELIIKCCKAIYEKNKIGFWLDGKIPSCIEEYKNMKFSMFKLTTSEWLRLVESSIKDEAIEMIALKF